MVPLKHTTSQSGWNFFGRNCEFIGIDKEYIKHSYNEIFSLVGYGFSAEYIESIPLEKRRYFIDLLFEKNKREQQIIGGNKEASSPLPNFQKEQIKRNQ